MTCISSNVSRDGGEADQHYSSSVTLGAPFDYSVLEVDRRIPHRDWIQKGYKDRTVR
jgi:hypothetical protein